MSVKKVSPEELAAHIGADLASCEIAAETSGKQETHRRRVARRTQTKDGKRLLGSLKMVFTDHAMSQFIERFGIINPGSALKNPQKTIRKLLARSRKEKLNRSQLQRLARHDFEEAEYYVAEGWRFVVRKEKDYCVVITVERTKPEQN